MMSRFSDTQLVQYACARLSKTAKQAIGAAVEMETTIGERLTPEQITRIATIYGARADVVLAGCGYIPQARSWDRYIDLLAAPVEEPGLVRPIPEITCALLLFRAFSGTRGKAVRFFNHLPTDGQL